MEESFLQRDLFHQYQKDLEVYTEHLHELVEQPLETFKDNDKRAEGIFLFFHMIFLTIYIRRLEWIT